MGTPAVANPVLQTALCTVCGFGEYPGGGGNHQRREWLRFTVAASLPKWVPALRVDDEGNCVVIDHGLGLFTLSMHFSRI
jgi:hypothetical protein